MALLFYLADRFLQHTFLSFITILRPFSDPLSDGLVIRVWGWPDVPPPWMTLPAESRATRMSPVPQTAASAKMDE
ncbi:MAG: hypothetical protein ACOY4W_12460 [Thermodesulfobacteriota bacterium]